MEENTEAKQYTPDRAEIYGYKLDRILGRGSTGTVYRGYAADGRTVAVKMFRANFFRGKLHVRDLAKCVKKFSKMQHPNIVQMYDFVEGADGACLIMEYVGGPTLRWYLRNEAYNPQALLVITTQMINGLGYLHENGFLHHDFKPANVMFTPQRVVKLADYSLQGKSLLLNLLSPGVPEQVTPMFVAPELIRKQKATRQTDMYALGVTMYLMFAGRNPFQTDNMQRLYECHLRAVPDHPSQVNPRCPRALGDLIMRLMNKKPDKRFKDCDQLRIALSEVSRTRI